MHCKVDYIIYIRHKDGVFCLLLKAFIGDILVSQNRTWLKILIISSQKLTIRA